MASDRGARLAGAQLETRVIELETRLTFQEQALHELSDALATTRQEIQRGSALLRRVMVELAQTRAPLDTTRPADEVPPHY